MLSVPIIATAWWGGAASSTDEFCGNRATVNCNTTFYKTRGAKCYPGTVQNGCMILTGEWNVIHPSIGFSEYFRPIYHVINSTTGKPTPWKEGEPMKDII